MTASNRNGRVLYRYGICLNDQCTKCKSKEIQEIGARKEFVCAECGKQLRECPRPKTWWEKNGKMVIIASVVVILGAIAGCFAWMGNDKKTEDDSKDKQEKVDTPEVNEKKDEAKVDSVKVDTIHVETTKEVKEVQPKVDKSMQNGHGTIDLGYAKYEGDIKNGKPHGSGTMTFKKTCIVPGAKGNIEAKAGEEAIVNWRNGEVNLVTLYQKDGNQVKIMHK